MTIWTWPIVLHLVTVVPAVAIGVTQLVLPKGNTLHRNLGRAYLILMGGTALISFFIQEINQWHGLSWIHLLSLLMLATLTYAVWTIRRGNRRSHLRAMIFSFMGAVIAGFFASLPGRRVGDFLWTSTGFF